MNQVISQRVEETIPEITKRYMEGRSFRSFASGLGINAKGQNVFQWAKGEHKPSIETLLNILASPTAEGWAKSWAGECHAFLVRQTVKN